MLQQYAGKPSTQSGRVMHLADQVRETIQQSLHAVLMTRRSVFF